MYIGDDVCFLSQPRNFEDNSQEFIEFPMLKESAKYNKEIVEQKKSNSSSHTIAWTPPAIHGRMAFPLIDYGGHQMTVLTSSGVHQTPAGTTAATTTIINANNDWRHHHTRHDNNKSFNWYNNSQRTIGTNLALQKTDHPTVPWYRDPFSLPLPPLNSSSHNIQVMPIQCVTLPDCSKPPPGLFHYPPLGSSYQSPGQESDSFFSEGSSMASSRHREEGPSHWDQGSDSAKGSTPLLEDQDSYWRTGAPSTSWYTSGPSTLSSPYDISQELLIAEQCRRAQAEIEDWADHGSVFDWDQYRLTEEEEEEKGGGKNREYVENECKEVVDMEICSIASGSNDEDDGHSTQPTQAENAFSESDRLTDSQMLSLLRHLSATDKNNNTNKNICHTIELFLTLIPVQMESYKVEQRKASMTSAQRQIFEFLHSKAPWVEDGQIIRSMDLLPFILKRILTSTELQQHSVQTPPTSSDQAIQKSKPSERHSKTRKYHHRKRERHSPRRSRSSSVHRRGRDRSRSPPHRKTPPPSPPLPPPRQRTDSMRSVTVPQSPQKNKGYVCQGRGRNIFTRSPEPRDDLAERRPGRGHRAEATVRLEHIIGGEEEEPTESRIQSGTEDKEINQKQSRYLLSPLQMKGDEAKWKKNRPETSGKHNRHPASSVPRRKRRTIPNKKRLANGKAPSLMTLSLPPLYLIRQPLKPKRPVGRNRHSSSHLTVKVPLLGAAPQSSRISPGLVAQPSRMHPKSRAPMAASSHRGLLPDPGSQEHLMLMGMETVSRLGLKFR